jgi:hypothetical protein
VRRRDAYEPSPNLLPGAIWRDAGRTREWSAEFDRARGIVLACKSGYELSQTAVAQLRADGIDARVLEGGYQAWAADAIVIKAELDRLANRRSVWVTRRRPKSTASPAVADRAFSTSPASCSSIGRGRKRRARSGGCLDIKDIELSHVGERCSFDTMLKLFGLEGEPSLARLALIVRGADTARPDIAPEAAGLHAVSLGLSALAGDDDHGLLERGFVVYDALFAWLRFAAEERHNWPAKAA